MAVTAVTAVMAVMAVMAALHALRAFPASPRLQHQPRPGIRSPRRTVLAGRPAQHWDSRQAVGAGEDGVAVVVGRDAHNRPGAEVRKHVVPNLPRKSVSAVRYQAV